MKQKTDILRITKTINAPLGYVFAWCTDFREDDPKLTGSENQRKVLEKTRRRAVFVTLYKGDSGREKIGVDLVTLAPPDAWHLEFFGEEDNETGEYRLTKLGRERTKLTMLFREKWKTQSPPTKAWQVQHTNEIWDKYVAALEADYSKSRRVAGQ